MSAPRVFGGDRPDEGGQHRRVRQHRRRANIEDLEPHPHVKRKRAIPLRSEDLYEEVRVAAGPGIVAEGGDQFIPEGSRAPSRLRNIEVKAWPTRW